MINTNDRSNDAENDAENVSVLFHWTDFSHSGQRWSFDADQLAHWDEEAEAFYFHSYHKLSEPTVESLIGLIGLIEQK